MASLQARHSRRCALGRPWTTFADATKERGCTCSPLYHVVTRDGNRLAREPAGHDRKTAERVLRKVGVEVDEDRYVAPRSITFERWADEWFASLRRPKENTKRVYRASIDYGKRAFGTKQVRKIGAADISRLLDLVADTSPASQRRHLRVLHGCFAVAVRRGYATRNPVAELEESAKPRAPERRPAYFTDAELARLWPELAKREPVYLHLCGVALTTGCRQGELVAIRWGSVRLLDRELHVDETYVQGIGLSAPKGNEGRTVDLTPAAVELLEQWFAACGSPGDHELVFPHPLTGGYLVGSTITRDVLYRAMRDAGIPREG